MTSVGQEQPEEGSAIGNLLCGSWELAQKILENLSYREVSRFRSVCKTWADVGEIILARRRPLHYLTVHPHSIPTTWGKVAIGEVSTASLFEGFFEHIVSKPRYCLGFCNADWLSRKDVFTKRGDNDQITLMEYLRESLPPTCELGLVSATGIIGTVETSYQGHWLKSAQNMNREILSFLNDGQEKSDKRSSKRLRLEGVENGAETNSRGVEGEVIEESGVEMESKKGLQMSTVGYSIEVEESCPTMAETDAVSLLVIPHHPGVQLKFFDISPQKFCAEFCGNKPSSKISMSEEEFNQVMSLSPNERLISLLLFDTCDEREFTEVLVQAALNRENYELALGGGVADALHISSSSSKPVPSTDHIFGIAVSGANIMAASVVIPEIVDNPKNIRRYMMQLKSCGLPEKQSVAIMFSCCGRGYSFWQPLPRFNYENVESRAFRKAFPDTPIFGFFGRGEMGITYLPKFSEPENERGEESSTKKKRKKSFHNFSTVIVLLSFL